MWRRQCGLSCKCTCNVCSCHAHHRLDFAEFHCGARGPPPSVLLQIVATLPHLTNIGGVQSCNVCDIHHVRWTHTNTFIWLVDGGVGFASLSSTRLQVGWQTLSRYLVAAHLHQSSFARGQYVGTCCSHVCGGGSFANHRCRPGMSVYLPVCSYSAAIALPPTDNMHTMPTGR